MAIDVRPSKPWVGGSNPSWITMKNTPQPCRLRGIFACKQRRMYSSSQYILRFALQAQKVFQNRPSLRRHNRLRMELHAIHRQSFMLQRHDFILRCFRRNL